MSAAQQHRPVHLVGSIPLRSVSEVFETVSDRLGAYVRRIPDGEVGPRSAWIGWQQQVMDRVTGIEAAGYRHLPGDISYVQYKIRSDVSSEDIDFRPIGYAAAARTSFAEFKRLRAIGAIAPATRFQISLPTPLAVAFAFFVPDSIRSAWRVYERQLLEEVREIFDHIPHEHLSFQWDVAVEITDILARPEADKQWSSHEVMNSITRLCEFIPTDVEVGIHLCYGDPGHKHIIEPIDMGLLVRIANGITSKSSRPISWFHMPVPRERSDDAYFEPLRGLKLKAGCELFIGLVHLTDGLDGGTSTLGDGKAICSIVWCGDRMWLRPQAPGHDSRAFGSASASGRA